MLKPKFLLLAGSFLALAPAHAQLAHRYDLNTANDSVGTANGTVVGTGTVLANGILTTTGAAGQALSLPASVGTGLTGNFSIEFYATSATGTSADFSSFFSIANAQTNFLLFNPNRGGANNNSFVDFRQAGATAGGNEVSVDLRSKLAGDTLQHQIVLTYNVTSGLASVYNNGVFAASGNIGAGFSLQSAANGANNGIGGGTNPYNDPSWNGSIADFRVYSQELTTGQVTALNRLGPDASNAAIAGAVPEPSTWLATILSGAAALFGLQRFRRSAA